MDHCDWSGLPSVVLMDIYKFLSTKDRLNASSTCMNWRGPVFQNPLEDTLHLTLGNFETESSKYQFLQGCFAHKVPHLSLTFDATSPDCMDLLSDTLAILQENAVLKTLRIIYTEQSVGKPVFHGSSIPSQLLQTYFTKKIIEPLLGVLASKNNLETLSFPLIQPLIYHQLPILETLASSARKNLSVRNILLSTIRGPEIFRLIPNEDGLIPFPHSSILPDLFNKFHRLQKLSVDHDVLNDNVLSTLGNGKAGGLLQLDLTAVQRNPNLSNEGWKNFVANNPKCRVRLTVMGGTAMVDHNSNLCSKDTPLTHFRALYCHRIRMNMLNSMIVWNERRLEHLELVNENQDWIENIIQSANEMGDDFIDPFIYAAWRVKTLRTIKIGYLYCGHDLIGVAKLAKCLNRLEIPKSQILHRNIPNLCEEVSKAIGKHWNPIDDGRGPGKSRSQILQKRMSNSYKAVVLDENY